MRRRSARYDDAVRVRSRLTELASRGLFREIVDEEDRLLAEGATRHVFADIRASPAAPGGDPRKTGDFRHE